MEADGLVEGRLQAASDTASYPTIQCWLLRDGVCASWCVPLRRRILPLLLVWLVGHWRVGGRQAMECGLTPLIVSLSLESIPEYCHVLAERGINRWLSSNSSNVIEQ